MKTNGEIPLALRLLEEVRKSQSHYRQTKFYEQKAEAGTSPSPPAFQTFFPTVTFLAQTMKSCSLFSLGAETNTHFPFPTLFAKLFWKCQNVCPCATNSSLLNLHCTSGSHKCLQSCKRQES